MLDRLRRRLTLLFSLLTAAVLGAALAVTCRMAQSQTTAASDLLFANTVAAVEDTVTGSGLVRDSWLARQEVAGQLVLYLEDNGRPLAFPGGWTPRGGRAAAGPAGPPAGHRGTGRGRAAGFLRLHGAGAAP